MDVQNCIFRFDSITQKPNSDMTIILKGEYYFAGSSHYLEIGLAGASLEILNGYIDEAISKELLIDLRNIFEVNRSPKTLPERIENGKSKCEEIIYSIESTKKGYKVHR